jgi:hypothetical protein
MVKTASGLQARELEGTVSKKLEIVWLWLVEKLDQDQDQDQKSNGASSDAY